jgi:hypothetical protein
MNQTVPVVVSPTAPGADTLVYVLFATVAVTGTGYSFPDPGWGKRYLPMHGLKRVLVDIDHSQAITLNVYKSNDRGASWHQVSTETTIAASATATTKRDYPIEEYDDVKVELVNEGVAQATFAVNVALTNERSATT